MTGSCNTGRTYSQADDPAFFKIQAGHYPTADRAETRGQKKRYPKGTFFKIYRENYYTNSFSV